MDTKKTLKENVPTWETVYQLPLKYDGYNYVWSKNDTMSLMFDDVLSEGDRKDIVKSINGESELKMENLTIENGCDFLYEGNYIFCIRGWGNLTGIGGLNLPDSEAAKIQDGFAKHVLTSLTKSNG